MTDDTTTKTPAPASATEEAQQQPCEGLTVRTIETPSLGDRTYVVHDGEFALVVDPQRDIDRVLEVPEADGGRLTHVFATPLHNDSDTGCLPLAQATGADHPPHAKAERSR